jgi:hypothetical protein
VLSRSRKSKEREHKGINRIEEGERTQRYKQNS